MTKTIALIIFCSIVTISDCIAEKYYLSITGNDKNSGISEANAWESLAKASRHIYKPGDEIILTSGEEFKGELHLKNQSGSANKPIVIRSTSSTKCATINGAGKLNGIFLQNCSNIIVRDLIITANGGGLKQKVPLKQRMRCGVLVKQTWKGNYQNIYLHHLHIKHIFFEKKGFKRGKDEVKSSNGTQSYGWGIRFINSCNEATLTNAKVTDCLIENVAHTGLKFSAKKDTITKIKVLRNKILKSGGPGMQISGVTGALFSNNYITHSGNADDSRKWGRGSGIWTWSAKDIIIEKNHFLNANGPGDSAGCHIDFNCINVIVQYNFSANNTGGFCEILGNNYNCAYRYNISVNDGDRTKGKNGSFQEGKTIWLSGYCGKKKPRKGPFNSYIYNNTIYTKPEQIVKIAIDNKAKGILIANNIFYIEGQSKMVMGDQYKPEKKGKSKVMNVNFKNNLYLKVTNWPKKVMIQDRSPIKGDPNFANKGGSKISDYIPQNKSLIKNKGIEISKLPGDKIGIKGGLKMKFDIQGNPINGRPDMGAIEIK